MRDFIKVFLLILGSIIFYGGLFFLRKALPGWLFIIMGIVVTFAFIIYILLLIGIRKPSDIDGENSNQA